MQYCLIKQETPQTTTAMCWSDDGIYIKSHQDGQGHILFSLQDKTFFPKKKEIWSADKDTCMFVIRIIYLFI